MKLYTSPSCSHCQALKAYLKNKGIDFTEIDITIDQDSFSKAVTKSGRMEVPLIEYKDKYLAGFNIKELEEIL
ncbi:MAG: glutaredoxin family protein [Clostridia bacterium]|jgi:glutaredoxin|nr:glutaredoxin family protein [Clostridia bacterium]